VFRVQASHLILKNGEKVKIHSTKVREKLDKKQEWRASINKGKNTGNTPPVMKK
jgi:nicotinic acid mononucleotide adenylyltransferase